MWTCFRRFTNVLKIWSVPMMMGKRRYAVRPIAAHSRNTSVICKRLTVFYKFSIICPIQRRAKLLGPWMVLVLSSGRFKRSRNFHRKRYIDVPLASRVVGPDIIPRIRGYCSLDFTNFLHNAPSNQTPINVT
jgi:hypothetical protein